MFMARQGDILFVQLEDAPEGVDIPRDAQGRAVIALGEVTGHAHAVLDIDVKWIETPASERVLISAAPFQVVHEEHAPILLPPGAYRVQRQREYSPERIRMVAD